MDELTKTIAERGDLAHLALFLWASGVLIRMPDFDGVAALAEDQASRWARIGGAGF